MGGRGASGRDGHGGGSGGGGGGGTKSEIGRKRDSVKSSVSDTLKGKNWGKAIYDESGKKTMLDVGIKRDGIKHVANDVFAHETINPSEIQKLNGQFRNASFVKESGLKHPRKDNIDKFYYFKAQGKDLYFNVGRKVDSNGKIHYELYSITKKI